MIYPHLKKKKKDNTLLHVENEVMFFEIKDFVAIYIERENSKYQIIGQWKKLNTTSRILSFRLCIVRD